MTTIESTSPVIGQPDARSLSTKTTRPSVAFLARHSDRTLDAYRHDLRALFGWTADHGLAVPDLEATRTHLELTGPRWKNAAWRPRPSTGAFRPAPIDHFVGSTDSPISMAASIRTQPSTSAAPRCTRRGGWAWTEAS